MLCGVLKCFFFFLFIITNDWLIEKSDESQKRFFLSISHFIPPTIVWKYAHLFNFDCTGQCSKRHNEFSFLNVTKFIASLLYFFIIHIYVLWSFCFWLEFVPFLFTLKSCAHLNIIFTTTKFCAHFEWMSTQKRKHL